MVRNTPTSKVGCFSFNKKTRETSPDSEMTPLNPNNGFNDRNVVVQNETFRKRSGITSEVYRQIETIENDYDASTAAAIEVVEKHGEMIVRYLDTRNLGKAAADAARRFLILQDTKHNIVLVEIIKRPGQTLGLFIREGNGMDRPTGVFINRISPDSSIKHSGCIQVGDEVLAVNLVDVTHMSIEDVVLIMSIPRRLVLSMRQLKCKSVTDANTSLYTTMPRMRTPERNMYTTPQPHRRVYLEEDVAKSMPDYPAMNYPSTSTSDRKTMNPMQQQQQQQKQMLERSRSHMMLDNQYDFGTELSYNSRPENRRNNAATMNYRTRKNEQQHSMLGNGMAKLEMNGNYAEQNYPKVLESLAQKVHPFCPGGSATLGRRTSELNLSSGRNQRNLGHGRRIQRTGSEQHLPRTECDDFTRTLPVRRLTRGGSVNRRDPSYSPRKESFRTRYEDKPVARSKDDYASDTEASYRASSHYFRKTPASAQNARLPTLSSSGIPSTFTRLRRENMERGATFRCNSLPRPSRMTTPVHTRSGTLGRKGFGDRSYQPRCVFDAEETDGTESAPEFNLPRGSLRGFSRGQYGNGSNMLTRTPSTSAIYDRLRLERNSLYKKNDRFTYSVDNLASAAHQYDLLRKGMRYQPGQLAEMGPIIGTAFPSATTNTLDRHSRLSSLRRLKHLTELEVKHLGRRTNSATNSLGDVERAQVKEINPSEFEKYDPDDYVINENSAGVSGLLWVHLLGGRGLKPNNDSNSTASGSGTYGICTRKLYSVVHCDEPHVARTIVREGDLAFDWDETFEIELVNNKKLDFLVYFFDPPYRHKLCYKGCLNLPYLMDIYHIHQLALKMAPQGTLYIRLRHATPYHTYSRKLCKPIPSGRYLSTSGLFGYPIEEVVTRENGVTSPSAAISAIPILVKRCIQELHSRERYDSTTIVGLYSMSGSAYKKTILRDSFERDAEVDISADSYPDPNVLSGVLKDYLRLLPEPLITKNVYDILVNSLQLNAVENTIENGNIIKTVLNYLPRVNKATLVFLMNHLTRVATHPEIYRMSVTNLARSMAPNLTIKSEAPHIPIDFERPICVLRCVLNFWISKPVREMKSRKKTPEQLASKDNAVQPPEKPNGESDCGGQSPLTHSKNTRSTPPDIPRRRSTTISAQPHSTSSSENSPSFTQTYFGPKKTHPPPEIPARSYTGKLRTSMPERSKTLPSIVVRKENDDQDTTSLSSASSLSDASNSRKASGDKGGASENGDRSKWDDEDASSESDGGSENYKSLRRV